MNRQKPPVSASLCLLAICIALTGFISACSSSGGGAPQYQGNSVDPSTLPPGTGAITFQIAWQQSSSRQILMAAAFNSCVDHGIGTISATVLSGSTTITSKSFPCALHQGTVTGVPAGSNYTLRIDGLSSGATTWSGQVAGVTVNAGQTNNAGAVVMTYVGADATSPTVTPPMGPNSNPAITTNVPITDRFNIVFSKSMAISTITSTNIALNSGAVAGTVTYDSASKTAAFIPSSPLAYDTPYTLQVVTCVTGSCITDTGNHQLSSASYSNTFTTESAPIGVASAPTGLTTKRGNGQVTLDWLAVNGAISYNVYYGTSPGVTTATGTQITGVRAPAVHLGLNNNTPYYYVVTAVSDLFFGESLASAESGTTPTVPAGNPAAPASLAVDYNVGTSTYTATWPTVAGMSYNVYWSTRAIYPDHTAADNVIRYQPGGQFVHTGVTNGLTYCYIVTAMNAAGESADSMQVCGPGGGSIQFGW